MLLQSQRKYANIIGAVLGLLVVVAVLVSNAPSSASPTLGATVKMKAYLGGSVTPTPEQPRNFLAVPDLVPGAPAEHGVLTLTSQNTAAEMISLGIDELTKQSIADIPFASSLEITFGANGDLGTTTLATMATTPLAPFKMNPGQTIRIPVSISLPVAAVNQAGGQVATIGIVPEVAK